MENVGMWLLIVHIYRCIRMKFSNIGNQNLRQIRQSAPSQDSNPGLTEALAWHNGSQRI
jgi:hypothetical protein